MGGRGSDGGIRGRLPGETSFSSSQIDDLPKLTGSAKQVAWAEQIRSNVLEDLWSYTIHYNSDGMRSDMAETYMKGTRAMEKSIRENPLVQLASPGTEKSQITQRFINEFTDVKNRIERFYSISRNTSASFWIDHRTNQLKNHMNKRLKSKIDGNRR